MNLAACIAELERLAPEITSEEIAEILWLSTQMGPVQALSVSATPPKRSTATATQPAARTASESQIPEHKETTGQRISPTPSPVGEDDYSLYAIPQGDGTPGGLPAKLVRVAAAKPLGDAPAIGRALRPLKRRVESRTESVTDVAATVDRIAEGGPLAPVLRPARERWLDLALVLDEGVSMRTWDTTLAALRLLLRRHGAFRRFQVWKLQADFGRMDLFIDTQRSLRSRRPRPASELVDTSGRKLILVASDCVAEGWRNGTVLRQIREWGKNGPVALLQMLPQRLWPATALGSGTRSIYSLRPGESNAHLRAQPIAPSPWDALADLLEDPETREEGDRSHSLLPVINLEDWSLRPWSEMLTAKPGSWIAGIDLQEAISRPRDPVQPQPEGITGAERVRLFRQSASSAAHELACYLAETPLSLPVMRLVQEVMLPDSKQAHLAEVVLGGLMMALPEPETGFRPDALMFEFHEGVADELRNCVVDADRNRVHAAVSGYLARREGSVQDFLAAEANPEGTANVDPLSKAFGKLKGRTRAGEWRPNRRWILVAGTGLRHGLPEPIVQIAKSIGRRLALDGYCLIVGEWPGVDYLVAQTYVNSLRNLGVPVDGHMKQYVAMGSTPDFPAQSFGALELERDEKELDRADAVILIQGGGTTRAIFERCVQHRKVVLPLAGSGGDAATAFASVASGGRDLPVDLRLLRYLSYAEAPEAITERTMTVLRALYDKLSRSVYLDWAAALFDLLPWNLVFIQAEHTEAKLFAAELFEASHRAIDLSGEGTLIARVSTELLRPEHMQERRGPSLESLLPQAQEWLHYDFTRLTGLAANASCWLALCTLTPLVIKHLPGEAQALIRAACAANEQFDPVELLEHSRLIDSVELDLLVDRVFGLTREQFALLLQLWRFTNVPVASRRQRMREYLEAKTHPLVTEDGVIGPAEELAPLMTNKDRINRHLAYSAFCAFPFHGAADVLVQALALEVADPTEGLSMLWVECLRYGYNLEPSEYVSHEGIQAAYTKAHEMVTAGLDPSGAWNVVLEILSALSPDAVSNQPLSEPHKRALEFVLRHILSDEEWEILEDLNANRKIEVSKHRAFRTTLRRIRDRGLIQGGRVGDLEGGEDLAKTFSITENGLACLAARATENVNETLDAAWIVALLLFNLISIPERRHLQRLSASGEVSFSRTDSLIEELRSLRDRWLIRNVGFGIGSFPAEGNYSRFLRLTQDGRDYLDFCAHFDFGTDLPAPESVRRLYSSGALNSKMLERCIEFLFEHFLARSQLSLGRVGSPDPAPFERSESMVTELRWLRSLGLISSRGPLHEMPRKGDLKSFVILTPEGRDYLWIKQSLDEQEEGPAENNLAE